MRSCRCFPLCYFAHVGFVGKERREVIINEAKRSGEFLRVERHKDALNEVSFLLLT